MNYHLSISLYYIKPTIQNWSEKKVERNNLSAVNLQKNSILDVWQVYRRHSGDFNVTFELISRVSTVDFEQVNAGWCCSAKPLTCET